ncbi:MAG: ROK family protein [Nitriliruptoraceae bacterium]
MADQVLAVDLGGTNMRAAVLAGDGELLLRRSQPTPREDPCPAALLGLVGGVLEDHPVAAAVIGVPGRIDHAAGALEYAPNLPSHWPEALREDLLATELGPARGLSSSGAALSALVRDGDVDAIEVRTAELGDDAGLVGAAGWSRATASPSTSGARS